MSAIKVLAPVFVVSFPEQLETGKLYVSMEFASVAHLCACGCGNVILTARKKFIGEHRFRERAAVSDDGKAQQTNERERSEGAIR